MPGIESHVIVVFMRSTLSPLFWILIVALAAHGLAPGLVVCLEPSGEVNYEAFRGDCCEGEAPGEDALSAGLCESNAAESCGPCTDTTISPTQVWRPVQDSVAPATFECTGSSHDPAAVKSRVATVSSPAAARAALIPVKTTALLI